MLALLYVVAVVLIVSSFVLFAINLTHKEEEPKLCPKCGNVVEGDSMYCSACFIERAKASAEAGIIIF